MSRANAFNKAGLRAGDVPAARLHDGEKEGNGFVNHGMMIDGKRFEAALQINEVELNFYTIDAMKQQYGRRLVSEMITSVRAHQTNEGVNYGGQNSSELIRDRHLVECVCPALHCHRRSPPPSPTPTHPALPPPQLSAAPPRDADDAGSAGVSQLAVAVAVAAAGRHHVGRGAPRP